MFTVETEETPSKGGVSGAIDAFNENAVVKSVKSWCWWAFRKSGSITWILTTTGIVVAFPLALQVQREIALSEAESQQIQQLQQQGYTPQQIQQMMNPQGAPQ